MGGEVGLATAMRGIDRGQRPDFGRSKFNCLLATVHSTVRPSYHKARRDLNQSDQLLDYADPGGSDSGLCVRPPRNGNLQRP